MTGTRSLRWMSGDVAALPAHETIVPSLSQAKIGCSHLVGSLVKLPQSVAAAYCSSRFQGYGSGCLQASAGPVADHSGGAASRWICQARADLPSQLQQRQGRRELKGSEVDCASTLCLKEEVVFLTLPFLGRDGA